MGIVQVLSTHGAAKCTQRPERARAKSGVAGRKDVNHPWTAVRGIGFRIEAASVARQQRGKGGRPDECGFLGT